MATYTPFLISNIKTGLQLNLEPWLIPIDAYASMKNVYLYQGALHKRNGYELMARTRYEIDTESVGASGSKTYAGTLAKKPLWPTGLTITDTVETFTDAGAGVLAGSLGGTGTIVYSSGVYSVTFKSTTGNPVTATYWYHPGNPVMGIWNYQPSSGTQHLLCMTTKRLLIWNTTILEWDSITKTDTFTGSDYDYFWCCTWQDVMYLSNNVDRVRTYNGTTLATLLMDTDNDTTNNITTAAFMFPYKDRLVALKVTEDGAFQPQRARWSAIGVGSDWYNGGFIDAPTAEWIMAAGFLKDELIVWFERSIWALRYTGNYQLPFRWVRLIPQEGSIAPMSLAEFSDEQLAFGVTSIISFDGRTTNDLAEKLSDFILDMNQEKIVYSNAGVVEELKQGWWTYPAIGSNIPNHILVFGYDDSTWSFYDIPMHCFGYYQEVDDPAWQDIDIAWEDYERSWAGREFQAGFPKVIGGDHDGYVWELNKGGADNSEDIYAEIITGQWNPYNKDGRRARLGWLDFLVNVDPAIDLQVDMYVDECTDPYKTVNINLGGDNLTKALTYSPGRKVWIRVDSGAEGMAHQFKLSHTASNETFVIHAICPYFKASGLIR
jgi:hypothetical protein